jgi:hypothetical protein
MVALNKVHFLFSPHKDSLNFAPIFFYFGKTKTKNVIVCFLHEILYEKRLVPRAGLEPARDIIPKDFKSFASTNSAIPAHLPNALKHWA